MQYEYKVISVVDDIYHEGNASLDAVGRAINDLALNDFRVVKIDVLPPAPLERQNYLNRTQHTFLVTMDREAH